MKMLKAITKYSSSNYKMQRVHRRRILREHGNTNLSGIMYGHNGRMILSSHRKELEGHFLTQARLTQPFSCHSFRFCGVLATIDE